MADDDIPLASLPDWLDPNQYRAVAPPTAADKASQLWQALIPQSIQGPSHADWERFHANEAAARARGEGYLGPTPDQNARTAAAFFGPMELGSMLPLGGAGILKGAAIPGAKAALEAAAPKVAEQAGSMGMQIFPKGMPPIAAQAAEEAPRGITAYHGSPHDFDRFDISKIGTGEGAQAYGHGLYFAENEGVARSYKQAGVGRNAPGATAAEEYAKSRLASSKGDRQEAIRRLEDDRSFYDKSVWSSGHPKAMTDAIDLLKSDWKPDYGRMYQVSIKADPSHFLDWDRPLSEQSEQTQNALHELMWNIRPQLAQEAKAKDWSGQQIHSAINRESENFAENLRNYRMGKTRSDVEAASESLRSAGIPGIKYLDQGSRVTPEQIAQNQQKVEQLRNLHDMYMQSMGRPPEFASSLEEEEKRLADLIRAHENPSRNYVIFDDKTIDILKKYGLLPLASMSALGAASQGRLPLSTMQQ